MFVALTRPVPVVGRAVAAIHRVRLPASGPMDPWHTDPVGADRWDELVGLLRAGGAPVLLATLTGQTNAGGSMTAQAGQTKLTAS